MPGSPQWSLSLRFPHHKSAHASPPHIRATCPANLIFIDFITCLVVDSEDNQCWKYKGRIVNNCAMMCGINNATFVPKKCTVNICVGVEPKFHTLWTSKWVRDNGTDSHSCAVIFKERGFADYSVVGFCENMHSLYMTVIDGSNVT
jgi:uncharacterized cysteine cluster protein YcgN (CxxCxxCC family)